MRCCKNALHLSSELHHMDVVSLPYFFSLSPSFLFQQNFPHFPALVSLVTLCCSLLECQDYASFYIRWLVPIVRWKKRTTLRERSQATGMPRQMASQANVSMWNTFLLSKRVIPLLSLIVWAT